MQRLVLSTADFPEADRFSYWREEVCERVIGVSGERGKGQETRSALISAPHSAHRSFASAIAPTGTRYSGGRATSRGLAGTTTSFSIPRWALAPG
jgi:hypothetical protein